MDAYHDMACLLVDCLRIRFPWRECREEREEKVKQRTGSSHDQEYATSQANHSVMGIIHACSANASDYIESLPPCWQIL